MFFLLSCSNLVCVELPYTLVSLTMMEDGLMSPDWAENNNSLSPIKMVFSHSGMYLSQYFSIFFLNVDQASLPFYLFIRC